MLHSLGCLHSSFHVKNVVTDGFIVKTKIMHRLNFKWFIVRCAIYGLLIRDITYITTSRSNDVVRIKQIRWLLNVITGDNLINHQRRLDRYSMSNSDYTFTHRMRHENLIPNDLHLVMFWCGWISKEKVAWRALKLLKFLTHIIVIIGSCNGLCPLQCQAIT